MTAEKEDAPTSAAYDDVPELSPRVVHGKQNAMWLAPTERYPWRVKCSGCGWIDHFDAEATAQEWADRHNASTTSWPHDAKVSPP